MTLNENELYKLFKRLHENKTTITLDIMQLLYDKGFINSFPYKNQAFEQRLTFSEINLKGKFGSTIPSSDGEYYLSHLKY